MLFSEELIVRTKLGVFSTHFMAEDIGLDKKSEKLSDNA